MLYGMYQDETDEVFVSTFHTLKAARQNAISERSSYTKEGCHVYEKMVEDTVAEFVLEFLKAKGEQGKELLWNKICGSG
jgi:hypothetical protein